MFDNWSTLTSLNGAPYTRVSLI